MRALVQGSKFRVQGLLFSRHTSVCLNVRSNEFRVEPHGRAAG